MSETYRSPVPPNWPEKVDRPGAPSTGWETSAYRWLMDQAPGDWRRYRDYQQHPLMLARDVLYLLEAELKARRDGYARARVDIATAVDRKRVPVRRQDGGLLDVEQIPHIPFPALAEYLQAHAEEAERLKVLIRQVELVSDALTGVRWVPRS